MVRLPLVSGIGPLVSCNACCHILTKNRLVPRLLRPLNSVSSYEKTLWLNILTLCHPLSLVVPLRKRQCSVVTQLRTITAAVLAILRMWPSLSPGKQSRNLMADSRFAPSQWETTLLCNDVSYWLCASLESALFPIIVQQQKLLKTRYHQTHI